MHTRTRRWDIFCSVVDNFGDIGVCWRLARQLSSELGLSVRLWVDDLACFKRICRDVDIARVEQVVGGVEVRRWDQPFAPVAPADIAIEGFGARLPGAYIEAMAARRPHPVWINLEYLSAESWVDGCHGLPSPHPALPLVKYFFFPGFTSATGGLLMEEGLAVARDEFQRDPAATAAFWRSLNLVPATDDALLVSLFCYDNAALSALVGAWSSDARPVTCIVPDGSVLKRLTEITGQRIDVGSGVRLGSLMVHAIPFLELDAYDRLLWACDLNFVRGEDSFVRAQLAARPLVWQAYPQHEEAHLKKTAAFLDRYAADLGPDARRAYCALAQSWNRQSTDMGRCWQTFRVHQQALAAHAQSWAARLACGRNLAVTLADFCEDRLQ